MSKTNEYKYKHIVSNDDNFFIISAIPMGFMLYRWEKEKTERYVALRDLKDRIRQGKQYQQN